MSVKPSTEFFRKYRPYRNDKPANPSARQISESDIFINICAKLGIKPTIRQARDFRRGMGRFSGVLKGYNEDN